MAPADLGEMNRNGRFVKTVRIAFDDLDGADMAVTDAGTEPVAVVVTDELRLAVDELDGPLRAGGDTISATVAEILVDLDNLSNCHTGLLRDPRSVSLLSANTSLTRINPIGSASRPRPDVGLGHDGDPIVNALLAPAIGDLVEIVDGDETEPDRRLSIQG